MLQTESKQIRMKNLHLSNKESNELTRTSIESALVVLMRSDDFRNISITEIVHRAGVSRTAYSRNYKSKEDILCSIIQSIIDVFADMLKLNPPTHNTYAFWYRLIHMIEQQ